MSQSSRRPPAEPTRPTGEEPPASATGEEPPASTTGEEPPASATGEDGDAARTNLKELSLEAEKRARAAIDAQLEVRQAALEEGERRATKLYELAGSVGGSLDPGPQKVLAELIALTPDVVAAQDLNLMSLLEVGAHSLLKNPKKLTMAKFIHDDLQKRLVDHIGALMAGLASAFLLLVAVTVTYVYFARPAPAPTIAQSPVRAASASLTDAVSELQRRGYAVVPAQPEAVLRTVTPSEGQVGTDLMLTGENLGNVTQVGFEGRAASPAVFVPETGVILTNVPTDAETGPVWLLGTDFSVQSGVEFTVLATVAPDASGEPAAKSEEPTTAPEASESLAAEAEPSAAPAASAGPGEDEPTKPPAASAATGSDVAKSPPISDEGAAVLRTQATSTSILDGAPEFEFTRLCPSGTTKFSDEERPTCFLGLPIQTLLVVIVFGAAGAIASLMVRIRTFTRVRGRSRLEMFVVGFTRPILGILFAGFVYVLTGAGLFPIDVANPTFFFAAIAFIAGFSERFAPDIMTRTETRLLGPDGGGGQGTPAS